MFVMCESWCFPPNSFSLKLVHPVLWFSTDLHIQTLPAKKYDLSTTEMLGGKDYTSPSIPIDHNAEWPFVCFQGSQENHRLKQGNTTNLDFSGTTADVFVHSSSRWISEVAIHKAENPVLSSGISRKALLMEMVCEELRKANLT